MKSLLRRAVERVARTAPAEPAVSRDHQAHGQAAFARAFAHHQAGRLQDAMSIYRVIVATHADYFDAWHMLGVAAFQSGDATAAQQYLRRALQTQPSNANALANLGAVLRASNPREAEA